jgi:hypothetical protein
MTSGKIRGLKCIRLVKLASQFQLKKAPLVKIFLSRVKKHKFEYVSTQ